VDETIFKDVTFRIGAWSELELDCELDIDPDCEPDRPCEPPFALPLDEPALGALAPDELLRLTSAAIVPVTSTRWLTCWLRSTDALGLSRYSLAVSVTDERLVEDELDDPLD
jgi:hypothetical protein